MANNVRIGVGVKDDATKPINSVRDAFARLQKEGAKGVAIGVGAKLTEKAFDAIGMAARKAADFIGDSIAAASDLNETLSKSSAVFGSNAAEVEKWGSQASRTFGTSKNDAIAAASSFADLFNTVGLAKTPAKDMSISLVELSADLASFHNVAGGSTEVLEKLRSGLSGEAEPMRRLGVFLNEAKVKTKAFELGLGDAHGELSDGDKILARYNIILDETKTAQGDFARTADQLANKQRTANATLDDQSAVLGEKMLPAQLAATNAQIDFFTALNAIGDSLSGKATPASLAYARALGVLGEEQFRSALAALQAKDAAAEAAGAYTQYEGKRGLWVSAAKKIGETLPEELEEAREQARAIANRTPQDMADALRDQRAEWQDAVEQLAEDLENPMSEAAEFAKIKGVLTGKNLARGLKSADPEVRARTRATRQILLDRLEDMGGDARKWGRIFTENLAKGMRDKIEALQRAARLLAKTQADYLKYQSPAKVGPGSEGGGPEGWGRNFGESMIKGMAGTKAKLAAESRTWAAIARPSVGGPGSGGLGGFGAPAHAGAVAGGAPVVIQLQVDGRTLAEIVDRNLFYMQSPGGILPRR